MTTRTYNLTFPYTILHRDIPALVHEMEATGAWATIPFDLKNNIIEVERWAGDLVVTQEQLDAISDADWDLVGTAFK
jgi:hypothetical protein